MGYNVYDVLNKVVVYITLNSTLRNKHFLESFQTIIILEDKT
jgi:hypothetical protein